MPFNDKRTSMLFCIFLAQPCMHDRREHEDLVQGLRTDFLGSLCTLFREVRHGAENNQGGFLVVWCFVFCFFFKSEAAV